MEDCRIRPSQDLRLTLELNFEAHRAYFLFESLQQSHRSCVHQWQQGSKGLSLQRLLLLEYPPQIPSYSRSDWCVGALRKEVGLYRNATSEP